MIPYIIKFSANPYDVDSGIPQWWPNYICEKELVSVSTDKDGNDVYEMKFLVAEQYFQKFDEYASTQLENYIVK